MIYFHVTNYKGSKVELSASPGYASIGVHYDGKPVGSLDKVQVQELMQYLVNNNVLDLDEMRDHKTTADSTECYCNPEGQPFSRSKPSCPRHFATG